jgi:hypothetical protein
MPFDKLYVKVKCPTCNGTRKFDASGYHEPNNPTKWKDCPYCDHDGGRIIEAADTTIIQHLLELPKERRDSIIAEIQKIPQEK